MKKLMFLAAIFMLSFSGFAEKKNVLLTESNTIVMSEAFNLSTVANLSKVFQELDAKLTEGDSIYLVMDSPGGSIQAGVEFCALVEGLNRTVHTISIFSASMGFHTVQCIEGKRYIFPQGTLMSHKAKGMFYGEFPGQIDSRYNRYLKRLEYMDSKVVERTDGIHTLKTYSDLVENEYWCDGADCIKQGFADEVITAKCDRSLNVTYDKVRRFIYQGRRIEVNFQYSKCPLITGYLSYQIFINGRPLFNYDKNSNENLYESFGENDSDLYNFIQEKVEFERRSKTKQRDIVKGY